MFNSLVLKANLCHKRNKGKFVAYPKFLIINVSKHTMTESQYTSIIWLTQDKYAIVDNDAAEWLLRWSWSVSFSKDKKVVYARTADKYNNYKKLSMHRHLMGVSGRKTFVDHENGNTLDNRKANLRICTPADNARNKFDFKTTTGFKGVSKKYDRFYIAQASLDDKNVYLGFYDCPIKAAKAYDEFAIKNYGEFARTNKSMGLL